MRRCREVRMIRPIQTCKKNWDCTPQLSAGLHGRTSTGVYCFQRSWMTFTASVGTGTTFCVRLIGPFEQTGLYVCPGRFVRLAATLGWPINHRTSALVERMAHRLSTGASKLALATVPSSGQQWGPVRLRPSVGEHSAICLCLSALFVTAQVANRPIKPA